MPQKTLSTTQKTKSTNSKWYPTNSPGLGFRGFTFDQMEAKLPGSDADGDGQPDCGGSLSGEQDMVRGW